MSSLLGGAAEQASNEAKELLDSILQDTVQSGTTQPQVTVDETTGLATIVGVGQNGETQAAVVSLQEGQVVAAELKDNAVTLQVQLPPGAALTAEGPSQKVAPESAKSFFEQKIQEAGVSQDIAQQLSVMAEIAVKAVASQAQEVAVRVVAVTAPQGEKVVIDASPSQTSEVVAVALQSTVADKVVELKGVESAVVLNDGAVQVSDEATVVAGLGNQQIIGSTGADTLVGGGGNDTLVGGGGGDVFGFAGIGHYVIEGTSALSQFAFKFEGINSLADLLQYLTEVKVEENKTTYVFVDGAASITLVGVKPEDITAEMVKFDIL